MKIFTVSDIRSWGPCYDPVTHPDKKCLSEDWTGTAIDLLKLEIPAPDRLWCVLRSAVLDDRTLRLFAVFCAREALKLVPNPDPRSVAACDIAEKFANGEATKEELDAAYAVYAAYAAYAAYAVYAAYAAAYAAARAAADAAADDAACAAYAAYAARQKQIEYLITVLEVR